MNAKTWLKDKNGTFRRSYTLYQTDEPDLFPVLESANEMSAYKFWKFMARRAKKSLLLTVEFCELMYKLHNYWLHLRQDQEQTGN